jgi:hypothetical protein
VTRGSSFVIRVAGALVGAWFLLACDTPDSRDASLDAEASFVDGDASDAAPSCEDFSGAYFVTDWTCQGRPATLCIAQQGCVATEYERGASVPTRGTAIGNALELDTHCTLRRLPSRALLVACTDPISGESCSGTAARADTPDDAVLCCNPSASICNAGDTCVPVAVVSGQNQFGVAACLPAGPPHEGEPCGPTADGGSFVQCAPGLRCPDGVCRPTCFASGADCAPPTRCVQTSDLPVFGACMPGCALLGHDCAAGETCRVVSLLQTGATQPPYGICRPAGADPIGAICMSDLNCPPDTGCFFQGPLDSPGHCLPFCHLGTDECGVGNHCVALVAPSLDEIGYCAPLQ